MKFEEKIGITVIAILIIASLTIPSFGWDYGNTPEMNASISQQISAGLSANLTAGILFTNGTQNNTQYGITNVDAWNNAIYNYPDGINTNTSYWVQSASSNTANVTVCLCARDDLKNATYSTFMNITYGSEGVTDKGGVRLGNFTGTGPGTGITGQDSGTNDYGLPIKLSYMIVGSRVDPGNYTSLRFFLNPHPDNVPSGIYNTTYRVRVVEYGQVCGTCT